MTDISIVIPTFNKAPLLIDILQDINKQTFKNFEVIVVDDESSDDTIDSLRNLNVNYSLRVFKTGWTDKFGMCRAYNIGISNAESSLTFLLNDDVYLHPTCLEHHWIAHHKINMRHALIGPRFKSPPYYFGKLVTCRELRHKEFRKYTTGRSGTKGYPLYRPKMMVSSNLSMSTEALRRMGGYNERFTLYTGEIDREFGDRLVKNRMSILYLWRAQAYSIRYWHPIYAKTKWLTDSSLRNNLKIEDWKSRQTSKAGRHMVGEAAQNPPEALVKSNDIPILERRV